jgi:CubicO group peptidase (beta-lactamase class C family)
LQFDPRTFDDLIFAKMSETKLPGVAASIIEDGRVVHQRAYGYKDNAAALPATPQTLYGIGSITKSFIAVSIAKLVEAGKMDFHDPVTKFLPLKQKAFEGVEVHHLLTHTSGIPGLGALEVSLYTSFGEYHHWLPISGVEDMSSFMSDIDDWVEGKPGKEYRYLNEGFVLLGQIVTKASGKPWEKFLKDEVLTPLKMYRTFIQKADVDADKDVATPYTIRGTRVSPTPMPYGSSAAGGLMSNVVDLTNYLMMFIDGGEFEGRRFLGKDTLEKMETPYAKRPAKYDSGEFYGYALVIHPDFHGHKVVSHGGSVDVFTSSMGYVRDLKSGVVLLTNGSGYSVTTLAMCAVSQLTGHDPSELPKFRLDTLLDRLEGEYRTYKGTLYAEVRKNGSFLMLSGEDIGKDIVLVPQGEEGNVARFYTIDEGARMDVNFRFNEHGIELLFERYVYRRSGPLRPQPPPQV